MIAVYLILSNQALIFPSPLALLQGRNLPVVEVRSRGAHVAGQRTRVARLAIPTPLPPRMNWVGRLFLTNERNSANSVFGMHGPSTYSDTVHEVLTRTHAE